MTVLQQGQYKASLPAAPPIIPSKGKPPPKLSPFTRAPWRPVVQPVCRVPCCPPPPLPGPLPVSPGTTVRLGPQVCPLHPPPDGDHGGHHPAVPTVRASPHPVAVIPAPVSRTGHPRRGLDSTLTGRRCWDEERRQVHPACSSPTCSQNNAPGEKPSRLPRAPSSQDFGGSGAHSGAQARDCALRVRRRRIAGRVRRRRLLALELAPGGRVSVSRGCRVAWAS